MKNFAITGVAGYIAPRHLDAIKNTGNRLVAAMDPHDSVGILDRYYPEVSFFTEFERFDRHLEKLHRGPPKQRVDYVSICSPNHLHDAHIRQAMRIGAEPICEKPLVLNPWNLDVLEALEEEYNSRINTVLQLRAHPSLLELKEKLARVSRKQTKHEVRLKYITARGLWYKHSWKGNMEKSGGIATNIGIHFFDMLIWLFGDVERSELHVSDARRTGGFLELENANVQWYLSLDGNDLPVESISRKITTYRSITVDGREIEFSGGFADLHTKVYEVTLEGHGFGIADVRPSIRLVHELRNAKVSRKFGKLHPFLRKRKRVGL
ncbi:MAG: Gfo/Idh/MocA family oxidoreductase [Balneolales bacterium]